MDVNEKLQQFGQSLEEISNKEYRQIEQDVDNEIKTGIEEEIKEYVNRSDYCVWKETWKFKRATQN